MCVYYKGYLHCKYQSNLWRKESSKYKVSSGYFPDRKEKQNESLEYAERKEFKILEKGNMNVRSNKDILLPRFPESWWTEIPHPPHTHGSHTGKAPVYRKAPLSLPMNNGKFFSVLVFVFCVCSEINVFIDTDQITPKTSWKLFLVYLLTQRPILPSRQDVLAFLFGKAHTGSKLLWERFCP